jgi:hypothetical protein
MFMPPNEWFTKDQERPLLQRLAEQRQSQTPDHHDPAWMMTYWLRKGLMP